MGGDANYATPPHGLGMEVKQEGNCVVVIMRKGENKITSEFIQSFHQALDTVEE